MSIAYSANRIFSGEGWLDNSAVIIENNIIKEIIPIKNLPPGLTVIQHAFLISPSFIDIQIYGANSKLFSVYPTVDTLYEIESYCKKGGANYFQPTIATNTREIIYNGIDAVRKYWESGGTAVHGLHIEGPWINPIKRGAHIESLIHKPVLEEVKDLLAYGKGVISMITLAPEICSEEIINLVSNEGIIVSVGHSNASYIEATHFFTTIHVATHLFNAMSPMHHREPGLPAAVLLNPSVRCSIVPDGYHVDFAMIELAKKLMGERLFYITDAVTETKEGPYSHVLKGDKYESNGILSGSALTMMKAVENGVKKCNISLEESLKMASLYPAKVLGIDNETGKIKPGYKADLVLIDEEFTVLDCI